jgi:hypothetical protein
VRKYIDSIYINFINKVGHEKFYTLYVNTSLDVPIAYYLGTNYHKALGGKRMVRTS